MFSDPWRPRFSIRGLLVLILVLGLLLGWGHAVRDARSRRKQQEAALRYAEEELRRARDAARERPPRRDQNRSFWEADLEGTRLTGMTITSPGNAFQKASFCDCQLDDSTLRGGAAAFQSARFDRASLVNAKLTGSAASFQGATFVDANLTNAALSGGPGSFQNASFENAVFVGATLSGNFQAANLSGARFEGADLSALAADDLASCYFKVGPSYDGQTKFPLGFDPVDRLWRRVAK